MLRDEPTRHGRAADAFIASYLRELLADDQTDTPQPLPDAPGERPATVLASTSDSSTPPRLEATL
jgi:hypothetical protein